MRFNTLLACALGAATLAVSACDDDPTNPGEINEQELITQVELTLVPVGGGLSVTTVISDPDGLGPLPPEAQTLALDLAPGVTYDGSVRFLDASDPAAVEDITLEVEEEAEEHRIFYFVTPAAIGEVPVASLDVDGNGAPLGLTFQLEVDAAGAGAGSLRIVLNHYDDTPKGDGLTQSTETDADVTFTFEVS